MVTTRSGKVATPAKARGRTKSVKKTKGRKKSVSKSRRATTDASGSSHRQKVKKIRKTRQRQNDAYIDKLLEKDSANLGDDYVSEVLTPEKPRRRSIFRSNKETI